MLEPYVGEIRLFGGRLELPGWVPCDGRELPIEPPHLELYQFIGQTFGGGAGTFALPDLRAIQPAGLCYIIAFTGAHPATDHATSS
jgi:microcystin-dependent protein